MSATLCAPMQTDSDITTLLGQWKSGNERARDQLVPLLYAELHRMADRYVKKERSSQTLDATALVHDAYLRLVGQKLPDWESRTHFFAIAANLMRQILVERSRRFQSRKRGGGIESVTFNEALNHAPEAGGFVLDLDIALQALAEVDERKSKVIELRFFAGLTVEEVAETLGISVATVGREQRMAEAWLYREMQNDRR